MEKYKQITPDQGIEKLLDLEIDLKTEEIEIRDGLKRIIAEDLYSLIDVPSFDKSPYDGYALNSEDTKGANEEDPVEFEIIEEIPAGTYPQKTLGKFQASKILTGAPLPKGANLCVKFEKTVFTDEKVKIFEEYKGPRDIIKAGEDFKKGDLLVKKGSILQPGLLGLISSQGINKIQVYKKPILGLFVTGSELNIPGKELEPGKIYESNSITFKTIFENMGFEVISYGVVKDEESEIEAVTKRAINESDIVVTTGGASVGDYDYALSSVKNLGGEILFWKTSMKPGGSIVASRLEGKTILGLSGNPGAAVLGLYRVCYPYLNKLLGKKDIFPEKIDLILKNKLNKKSPRLRLLRGSIEFDKGKAYFVEKQEQGNGILSSFIDCDAFAEIPAGSEEIEAGTLVKAYRVSSLFGSIGE